VRFSTRGTPTNPASGRRKTAMPKMLAILSTHYNNFVCFSPYARIDLRFCFMRSKIVKRKSRAREVCRKKRVKMEVKNTLRPSVAN
jgi:hypothetical protein